MLKCRLVVSKCKKAVICLREELHVLNKLHSFMNYSAVGHEVKINNAVIYAK